MKHQNGTNNLMNCGVQRYCFSPQNMSIVAYFGGERNRIKLIELEKRSIALIPLSKSSDLTHRNVCSLIETIEKIFLTNHRNTFLSNNNSCIFMKVTVGLFIFCLMMKHSCLFSFHHLFKYSLISVCISSRTCM